MHIWVDADACPVVVKDILFRAAERTQIPMTLVANQYIRTPPSQLIRSVQVAGGFDVADKHIADQVQAGDLVITQDIPLADSVIDKGAEVITPRGDRLTKDSIKQRLSVRNFMEELRSAGVQTGGPPPLNQTDRQTFANQLDRWLARQKKSS